MSTDLAVIEGNGSLPVVQHSPQIGGLVVLPQYVELVRQIAATPFVPDALRGKPHEILACMLKGYELGMGPMQSLDSIDVIQGRPALKPEAMRALAAQQGHQVRIVENTERKVTVAVHRREWPADQWDEFSWTMDDAARAGLANKDSWKKYPRAMLLARATSEACRAVLGDVIKGLSYTPDEVESFDGPPAPPPGVSADTGEIVGGGQESPPTPPAPAPASTRRSPPGRARQQSEEVGPGNTSKGVSLQAGASKDGASATISEHALASLRAYAANKGLDEAWLVDKAGKPLAQLTEPESQALTATVTKHKASAS